MWSAPIRPDQFQVPRAADAGHLGAERLGDLDRERAHASGSTVDQHPLSCLKIAAVAESLECCHSRHRYRRGLREAEARGFRGEFQLGVAHVFGEGPVA